MTKKACQNQSPRKGHAHSPGSYKAKTGRKTSRKGKQEAKRKLLSSPKVVVMAWKRKLSKLMAMLALESGYSLNAGEARMVLLATLRLLEERDLVYNPNIGLVEGVDKVFGDIAQSFGTTKSTVRRLFQSFYDSDGESYDITDNTTRGLGSPAYDRAVVRALTLIQCRALETYIEHRNSSKGAGKVTLDEMAKYMHEGAAEGSGDPPLSPDLRVSIPRTSLRFALIHHLGYKRDWGARPAPRGRKVDGDLGHVPFDR